MTLTFQIPGPLRGFTGGQGQVQVSGAAATVGQALELLCKAHPGLRDRVLTEQGQVREHINVFVGNEAVRFKGGLATPVDGKSEISIIPAISGGAC
jgi:molybdopterin converting factor small subunit